MTSPAITQKGIQYVLGFQGNLYTGFQMNDATEKPTAEVAYIADDNDNDATQLVSDLGRQYVLNGVILAETESELSTLQAIKIGDDITINSAACFVTDVNLTFGRLDAAGSITAETIPAVTAAEAV